MRAQCLNPFGLVGMEKKHKPLRLKPFFGCLLSIGVVVTTTLVRGH